MDCGRIRLVPGCRACRLPFKRDVFDVCFAWLESCDPDNIEHESECGSHDRPPTCHWIGLSPEWLIHLSHGLIHRQADIVDHVGPGDEQPLQRVAVTPAFAPDPEQPEWTCPAQIKQDIIQ